jgi:hypothetical protein
LYQKKY